MKTSSPDTNSAGDRVLIANMKRFSGFGIPLTVHSIGTPGVRLQDFRSVAGSKRGLLLLPANRDGNESTGTRTQGPRLKRALLYRLSYALATHNRYVTPGRRFCQPQRTSNRLKSADSLQDCGWNALRLPYLLLDCRSVASTSSSRMVCSRPGPTESVAMGMPVSS